MVPRGEVGLIFAQMGLASGVFDAGLFGGVTLMVMVTTLLAPPTLKFLLRPSKLPKSAPPYEHLEDLVNTAESVFRVNFTTCRRPTRQHPLRPAALGSPLRSIRPNSPNRGVLQPTRCRNSIDDACFGTAFAGTDPQTTR